MKQRGVVKSLYKNNKNKAKMHNKESTEFETKVEVKQGCVLSPLLFSIVLNDVIKVCIKKCKSLIVGN